MKYNRLYIVALLLLALGMAGCSATDDAAIPDSEGTQQGQMAVSFATRSVDSNDDTSFAKDDVVNLIATTNSGTGEINTSNLFTYDGTAWDKTYIVPSAYPVSLTAVYSSTKDATATAFTLPNLDPAARTADQSTADLLRAADYMTSASHTINVAPVTPTAPIGFELQHHMCKVNVTISSYGTEFGSNLPNLSDIKIISKGSGITLSYAKDGTATATTAGNATDVTPFITSGENSNGLNKYEAIVTPGIYPAASKLMTLSVDGLTMNVPLSEETTFVSGKTYAYTLAINKRELVLSLQGTIPGWTDDEKEL